MSFVTNMTYRFNLYFVEMSRLIKVSNNIPTTGQLPAGYFTLEPFTNELGRAACRMWFRIINCLVFAW